MHIHLTLNQTFSMNGTYLGKLKSNKGPFQAKVPNKASVMQCSKGVLLPVQIPNGIH